MSDLSNILTQFLQTLADEMKSKLKNPNGTSGSLISVEVTEEANSPISTVITGTLKSPSYIYNLEYGRGPTINKTAGSPTLQQAILAWVNANSFSFPLQPNGIGQKVIKNAEAFSWAIAMKIHREGMKAPAKGILTDVLTPARITAFVKTFSDNASEKMLKEIIKQLRF